MDEATKAKMQALGRPFPAVEHYFLPKAVTRAGDKALALVYITARHVMDRLDEVVPGEWSFTWLLVSEQPHTVVKGSLKVGGQTFEDCGEAAQEEEPFKSAVSDALKRCAVQAGIGRYLYTLPQFWLACISEGAEGAKKFKKWDCDPSGSLKLALSKGTAPAPSQEQEQERPTEPGGTGNGGPDLKCADCEAGISAKVLSFSVEKFGKPLCMPCQKKAG